ncbi:monocarboxylate transporter [Pleurotus eryngii]|uniref:Monocarboxylate transporter n=1 Tax=Pleurotus eryngii TaxID=5323 RepID=A0A9P6DBP5_PLEER|nr:monocarboxylate transporter [Pleurotus eryngii]
MTAISRDIELERISSRNEQLGPPEANLLSEVDRHSSNHADRESSGTAVQAVERPTKQYQMLLLLSGFFMTFHVIGINSVYGIFQEFYTSAETNILDAHGQDALVALVGTIGSGLTWSGSIFVNPLMARIDNVRMISLAGAIIMSIGLFAASYSTRLWHLYLTQAVLYGVGSSMYYFPIMSIAPVYFDRHRGFAMGVILAGSGVGGLVIAPVLQVLLDKYGVQWALRILGIWNLVIGLPVSCVVKHRPGFGTRGRTRLNLRLVTSSTFIYQALAAFLQAAGNIIPVYYLSSYCVAVLNYPRSMGSLLLAINSGVNSVSRISMGILADHIGRQNTLIAGVMLSSLSVLAVWYNAPRAQFVAFTVLYGIYAGGYNALLPTTITEIYGVQDYASVNGFIYFIRGLGSIGGAPIAGVILGSHKRGANAADLTSQLDGDLLRKRYNDLIIYSGVLLAAAGLCVTYVRWLHARARGQWSWKA